MCLGFGGRRKGYVDWPGLIVLDAVAGVGSVCEGWGGESRDILIEEEGIPRFPERTRRWKELERERWTRWR